MHEDTDWHSGMKDEDGNYIPSPNLTPKQRTWAEQGRPIMKSGIPCPPWINHAPEKMATRRAEQNCVEIAEAALGALRAIAEGAGGEIVEEQLRDLIPMLLETAKSGSSSTMKVRAAKIVADILLALVDLVRKGHEQEQIDRPLVSVHLVPGEQLDANGKVVPVMCMERVPDSEDGEAGASHSVDTGAESPAAEGERHGRA
jgi:hypothetical protein